MVKWLNEEAEGGSFTSGRQHDEQVLVSFKVHAYLPRYLTRLICPNTALSPALLPLLPR